MGPAGSLGCLAKKGPKGFGLGVKGFRVWGFRGLSLGVQGFRVLRVWGLWFTVWGLRFGAWGYAPNPKLRFRKTLC